MSALHYTLKGPIITNISKEIYGDLLIEPFAIKPGSNERERLATEREYENTQELINENFIETFRFSTYMFFNSLHSQLWATRRGRRG